jgi:hypothetical protein
VKNGFLFSWDCNGLEALIPLNEYEQFEKDRLFKLLKEERIGRNPLDTIIQNLIMRARANPQRNYEIYAVDCDPSLDEKFWREHWESDPQFCADLLREKGHKIYSDRETKARVIN